METLLQLTNLDAGEGGPRLLPLRRGAVLVRVADPSTGKAEGTWKATEKKENDTVERGQR